MSTPYYSENTGRSYPFLSDTTGVVPFNSTDTSTLPNEVIVDFGCTMGMDSAYIAGTHYVALRLVRRGSGTLTFRFVSNAPGLDGYALEFTFNSTDKYRTVFADAIVIGDVDSDPEACVSGDRWYGLMTCGDLEQFYDDTAPTEDVILGSAADIPKIEPALVISLVGSYVRSINLANQDRTRATRPAGCTPYTWPFDTGGIFVNARCIDGDTLFMSGFNVNVRKAEGNAIVLDAGVGDGLGEPGSEIPLSEEEVAPEGSSLLTGGPACGDLIRTINGVSAKDFTIDAGLGAKISLDPDNHLVEVDINMSQLSVCDISDESDTSEECPELDCDLEE